MTMKKFDTQVDEIKLLPTEEQVGMLLEARTRLQTAREAVAAAQRMHYTLTGEYLRQQDITGATPKFHIPEAMEISRGVIDTFIVRGWIAAGRFEGRGDSVDERKVSYMYYPTIRHVDETPHLKIPSIGCVKMAEELQVDARDVKAFLQFPDEVNADWRVAFYGDTHSTNGTGDHADAEPPVSEEPTEEVEENPNATILRESMLFLAESTLKTDALTDDERTAIELMLEVFA